MKVRDLIAHLEANFTPDQEIAYTIWSTEDVDTLCDENGLDLSKEEKEEAIRLIHRISGGETGITWDTIEYAIDEVKMLRTQVEI